ncbi:hypothetical protein LSH36_417g04021 [Paralvinella palmiformis]|uniref:Connective tissue growth factor n=1 Tax=Paralvinella palmiformis TaxID=53620 RepID=A0AAD9JDB8_9ANNE|nr:hypothetical protein LSH36_417g04021 [Paralvinella palmiformis]
MCMDPCKLLTSQCKAGVNIKKDGCGCCFICTRQQGDLCDAKYICDEDKGLYCDFKFDGGLRGICRAKAAKPCNVDGNIYKDGEEFKLNCSQLCTCQNGQYACSTLCPQEDRPPSAVHCKEPILVQIESRCCREWVCPHSHSLPGPDDTFPPSNKPPPKECKIETTEWSACSQTCGMGVSIRVTNDNKNCETMQERRLCFVRPCDMNDRHLTGHWCKNTWRNSTSIHFVIDGCRSVKDYRPKYCATCKKHRCCYPEHSETREMEFECTGRVKYRVEKFMWIKNCEGKSCKSTWKESKSRTLVYGECESVLKYRPKYCSTCKKRKCCGPGRTKTRRIQFKCPDGKLFTEQFMWVKNCECFKTRRCPF